ncbi:unnamed protein product [Linum trigynum]
MQVSMLSSLANSDSDQRRVPVPGQWDHRSPVKLHALDPLCAASNVWFCSPTDSDISGAQEVILSHLTRSLITRVPDAYVQYSYSSCAYAKSRFCHLCLAEATARMRDNCLGKDGGQYGNELSCAVLDMKKKGFVELI